MLKNKTGVNQEFYIHWMHPGKRQVKYRHFKVREFVTSRPMLWECWRDFSTWREIKTDSNLDSQVRMRNHKNGMRARACVCVCIDIDKLFASSNYLKDILLFKLIIITLYFQVHDLYRYNKILKSNIVEGRAILIHSFYILTEIS